MSPAPRCRLAPPTRPTPALALALALGVALLLALTPAVGCSSYKSTGSAAAGDPRTDTGRMLSADAYATELAFKQRDPTLRRFFESAHGYAIFPEVTKGGAGLGGAHGDGVVYEQGQKVGYTELSQGSIGLQLGGQKYAQLIFFQDAATLDRFKRGGFAFAAQASAVAASNGAGANADYAHGVAVFTTAEQGLMFEAAVGGQRFEYYPIQGP
jgi:lipid-binding SYLF domain-containing protein